MKTWSTIRDVYGQLRGYNRLAIRREVERSTILSADELADKTSQLRLARYRDALARFPAYAELVKERTGCSSSEIGRLPFEKLPVLSKSDITTILSTCLLPTPHSPLSPVHPPQSTPHSPLQTLRSWLSALSSKLSPLSFSHSTGGSTGEPFKFFITRESFEWRSAVSDRGYSFASAEEGQRSFYVWGTAIKAPSLKQKLKAGFHHWLQNRAYFDSFHFNDEDKAECCRQINAFKPVSLVGYTGNLIELARYVSRNPKALQWRAKTAVTAAEGLCPGMREMIEKYLVDEVYMSYGSREFMLIGMECKEHNGYHVSSDNLYVEVVDDTGMPLPAGELGRIVVTDLHNDATPFIRYAIGDLGSMGATANSRVPRPTSYVPLSTPCSCGLPFPVLASVEGRLQEVIVKADGEKLTALFIPHLMKEFEWVDGYQVVQDDLGTMVMNLVTRDDHWNEKSVGIREELMKKLGEEMQIGFERVAALEKNASGKTPIVRSGT